MRQDPWSGAVNQALNTPGRALAAFWAGYFIGRHGLPAGIAPPGTTQDNISVHFSPNGGCTDAIVAEIGAAKQTILVQAYSFTSRDIANALIDAHHRGVKVTLVRDKEQDQYSKASQCAAAGISVYIDTKHQIAHNKIMLIDGRTIITGSFNFTSSAEHSNAENLLVMHDKPQLFAAYERNFQQHLAHSDLYNETSVKSEPRRGR